MPLFLLIFLADASAAANASGALWITGGLAASGGISTIISLAALFATRREVEALEKRLAENINDLKQLREDLSEMERRLTLAGEQRALEAHRRTNEILSAVARLGGQFDQQTHSHDRPH
jgi:membrane protein implicated in regulation of membrane protease activity